VHAGIAKKIVINFSLGLGGEENCRSLGFARDDKGEGGEFYQEPSDRMAEKKPQIPPLRFAPVGMTILLWIHRIFLHERRRDPLATELSSRRERTRISCYA
jgi:hypothetical protein